MLSIKLCANWFAFILLLLSASFSFGAPGQKVSDETLKQLKLIEESINVDIDPCDDFYGYACGNWPQHHSYFNETAMFTILYFNYKKTVDQMISAIKSPWEYGLNLEDKMNQEMGITSTPPREITEGIQTFADKLYVFMKSCTNPQVNAKYFKNLKPDDNLEWPLMYDQKESEEQNFENFNLFATLGKLFGYGMNKIILQTTLERFENETLHVTLDLPSKPPAMLSNIQDMLFRLGLKDNSQKFNETAAQILDTSDYWYTMQFEFRYTRENNDVITYNELKEKYPQLAIFIENMLPNDIKPNDIIEICNLDYMKHLFSHQWDRTQINNILNYISYELFQYLNTKVSLDCPDSFSKFMHLAVNFLYYEKYIKADAAEYNEAFDILWNQMSKYVKALVEENNLNFPPNMQEAIMKKLERLDISKGNLPPNVDAAMVEEFYSDLPNLKPEAFEENILHLLKYNFRKTFNCPKGMECIADLPPTTFNIPTADLMVIPFASFAPPMYHWHFDPLLSVSLMGTLLGHEFAHSIDSTSLRREYIFESLYEDFNNHPELNDALDCMNDQDHSEYLRERIADFVGAKAAYRIYANEYNIQPSYTTIPWEKFFFLNMAQYFCQRGAEVIDHDASDLRLRQIAMNSKEFSEAFQCPIGSKMNPEKKCRFY